MFFLFDVSAGCGIYVYVEVDTVRAFGCWAYLFFVGPGMYYVFEFICVPFCNCFFQFPDVVMFRWTVVV